MSVFKDKVLLITGGTGSFGNAVLRRFETGAFLRILPYGSGHDQCDGYKQCATFSH